MLEALLRIYFAGIDTSTPMKPADFYKYSDLLIRDISKLPKSKNCPPANTFPDKYEVWEAFSGLEEFMQKVIYSYYFEQKPVSEIAVKYGRSISTTRVALQKGMHRLRLRFNTDYARILSHS